MLGLSVAQTCLLPYLPSSSVDGHSRVDWNEQLDLNHTLYTFWIVLRRFLARREAEDYRHVCRIDGEIASHYQWSV